MDDPRRFNAPKGPSCLTRHASVASQDTNASGFADSTISYGESLRLSQFPPPPSSIPSTPIPSDYSTSTRMSRELQAAHPLSVTRRGNPFNGTSLASSSSESPASRGDNQPSRLWDAPPGSTSRTFSPYDWHEGASSIDVDAAEDRLLPTSFITSLLQENAKPRRNQRMSVSSDAISGISEMTYPPLMSYAEATRRDNLVSSYHLSTRNPPSVRPMGARLPPSSFTPIPEYVNRMSGDSDTLYSNQDRNSSIVRKSSVGTSLSVTGVARATLYHVAGDKHLETNAEFSQDANPKQYAYSHTEESGIPMSDDDSIAYYKALHASAPYSSVLPSTSGNQRRNNPDAMRPVRDSVHSSKSASPSLMSRLSSNKSLRRVFTWRKKPLPPVPTIPHISIATEREHRKAEESTPLPDLLSRAGALHGLLEKGHHPHHSLNSHYRAPEQHLTSPFDDASESAAKFNGLETSGPSTVQSFEPFRQKSFATLQAKKSTPTKKCIYVAIGVLIAVIIVVATVVSIVVKRNKHQQVCSDNLAGATCSLNATCVCVSSSSGQCDYLAQNIVNLIPDMNAAFQVNMTTSSVYRSIWQAQGAPSGSNCATQSLLVDIGSVLDSQKLPNRTQWAQAALLWNLVQTQDLTPATQLQTFIIAAPWNQLEGSDGPVYNNTGSFSTLASGYLFDFAAQTVTQPSKSFVDDGQPLKTQIAQVGPVAQSALDRMYTFAVAASTQRENALMNFWNKTLQQRQEDLNTFKSALSVAPILLPFDATTQTIRDLYANSTPTSFPPPLACYPGLETAQLERINTIETEIFELKSVVNATQFDDNCYPERPVYGILDILHLRLPFNDSRADVAKQAASLERDAVPRAVLYAGEILSAMPVSSAVYSLTGEQLDPRQYGTLSHPNHVLLQYLSSIPDVGVAKMLVQFVLNSATSSLVPPTNSSSLYQSLGFIPPLEVAVFGAIGSSDITSAYSSFTTSSNSLFFGSDAGSAMRKWAIGDVGGSVIWTESAVAPLVVRDSSMSDTVFNDTWAAVAQAISSNARDVGLVNITTTFQNVQKFSP
ncbi:hypothetical protein BDQ12DRAFT_646780 [Crucibulum laeve]|uniref:Uncharacterized protein n=1 Tax=Crucibulum laeve TaxID=68775 RepID=A0A5C3M6N2_9AGAR|nr:hypothetical protein BDQ12DRAFT_646780 [Crucibulum laeve]